MTTLETGPSVCRSRSKVTPVSYGETWGPERRHTRVGLWGRRKHSPLPTLSSFPPLCFIFYFTLKLLQLSCHILHAITLRSDKPQWALIRHPPPPPDEATQSEHICCWTWTRSGRSTGLLSVMREGKWKTPHAARGQLGLRLERKVWTGMPPVPLGDGIDQSDWTKSLQACWGHFLIGQLRTKRYIVISRLYNAAPVMPFTGFRDIDKALTPRLITYRPIRI